MASVSASGPCFLLRVVRGARLERTTFPLSQGTYTVGSAAGASVVLPVRSISRKHAELVVRGGGVRVRDLSSKNGTFVDGRRIETVDLVPGDEIRFAAVVCRLERVGEGDGVVVLPAPSSVRGSGERFECLAEESSTVGWTAYYRDVSQALGELVHGYTSTRRGVPTVAALLARLAAVGRFHALALERRESGEMVARAAARPESALGDGFPGIVLAAGETMVLRAWGPPPESTIASFFWEMVLHLCELAAAHLGPFSGRDACGADENQEDEFVTADPGMERFLEKAARLARAEIPLLIHGETGVGKEVLARWIHRRSSRRDGPFLALNCAALPRELQEAELFGVESGVATGVSSRVGLIEQADGGTLLLDDIAEMPAELQPKLLRVVQERHVMPLGARRPRPVNVRFIATTNRDLRELVTEGGFREDLYYRIAGATLHLPPLRERAGDILLLAGHFLERACRRQGVRSQGFTAGAVRALLHHTWPGNVRELEHEIAAAAALLEPGEPVSSRHILQQAVADPSGEPPAEHPPAMTLQDAVERARREALRAALEVGGGDPAVAAAVLGVSRSTLYRLVRELGLVLPRGDKAVGG